MIERRAFLRWLGATTGGLCLSSGCVYPGKDNGVRLQPAADMCVLENTFGKAEIDVRAPSLIRLHLRQSNGEIGGKQLLSRYASDFPEWAVGGTSYFVGEDGKRYEARLSTEHRLESDPSLDTVRIVNIRPRAADGTVLGCTEDWTLSVTGNGGLRWEITRTFEEPFNAVYHGGPALFFNISPNAEIPWSHTAVANRHNPAGNGVAINWWVAADALNGENLTDYKQFPIRMGFLFECLPPSNSLTMRSKEGWAIFKLYTSFPHDQDLRIKSEGGHLYRRGMFFGFQEVGVTAGPSAAAKYKSGQSVRLALEIEPIAQFGSGQQLMVQLPDPKMEKALKSYFSGLVNAGCLIDCERHFFGNQPDGFFYAGNMHWHSYSLLASCHASSKISSAPISYPEAFRKTLSSNLDAVDERGEVMHGYRHDGAWPGLPMMNLIALEAYLLYSGDIDYARRYLSTVKQLESYLERWLKDGVFHVARDQIVTTNQYVNWYYDIVVVHGYTMYHNVNCVRSMMAIETIYTALGETARASACSQRRQQLVSRINDVFWDDNAYGQDRGGYIDWIPEDGEKRKHFFACHQYPAILFDIASPDQARKILTTADERIRELKQYHNYKGDGTLDNLWPLKAGDVRGLFQQFGGLCNGGMLIAMTFWEIAARCHAGAPDGAHELLKNFSEHAAKTNWFEGANGFGMNGKPSGPFYEPFLSDGLIAAAGLVHGFLGLSYGWDNFSVKPHLPSGWDEMSAQIMFKGAPYKIHARADGQVSIVKGT